MRRLAHFTSAVVLAASLGACATAGSQEIYGSELRTLEQSCAERQGVLVPTGTHSTRPQTDYACRVSGTPSRLDQ